MTARRCICCGYQPEPLPAVLRTIRAYRTQTEMAAALGVSQKQISEWENGHYTPLLSTLQSYADFADITITQLFEWVAW